MTGAGGSSARVKDYSEYFLFVGELLDRFIQGKTDYILFLMPEINCARLHAALAHELLSGAWILSSMHWSGVQFSRNYDRILFEGAKEVNGYLSLGGLQSEDVWKKSWYLIVLPMLNLNIQV